MYYDDEARRFNFVSGLLLGGALGMGLALLADPRSRLRRPRHLRDGYERARGGAESGASLVREGLSSAVERALAASRR